MTVGTKTRNSESVKNLNLGRALLHHRREAEREPDENYIFWNRGTRYRHPVYLCAIIRIGRKKDVKIAVAVLRTEKTASERYIPVKMKIPGPQEAPHHTGGG